MLGGKPLSSGLGEAQNANEFMDKNDSKIGFYYLNSFDLTDEQSDKLTLSPPSILLYENATSEGVETQLSDRQNNLGFY